MKWKIDYSRDALKFLEKENISNNVSKEIIKFLKRMRGENIKVDVKKLKGSWQGYYRLKKGKIRIIFEVDYPNRSLFIKKIDFRGDVYK